MTRALEEVPNNILSASASATASRARFTPSKHRLFGILGIFCLTSVNTSCFDIGAFVIETDIGQTEIDEVILWQGHNPGRYGTGEASPLSRGIRTYLMARATQDGASAVEAALLEAKASCRQPIGDAYRCEIRRFETLRSAVLIGAKTDRTDWIVSISYDRRGGTIGDLHVSYTETSQLLD